MNDRKSDGATPLPAAALRWRCSTELLEFPSTADVEPVRGVVGQPLAAEALRFALDCGAQGQNVFVRGERGTGRMTMIRDLLDEIRPVCRTKTDRCYVHNFLQPDRPRLISLPRGQGRILRRRLNRLADFAAGELSEALNSRPLQASRVALQEKIQAQLSELTRPFEEELGKHDLALVQVKTGQGAQAAIFPVWQGQPIPPEKYDDMVREETIGASERDRMQSAREEFSRQLPELTSEIGRLMRESSKAMEAFNEKHIRRIVGDATEAIKRDYSNEALHAFLDEVVDDVVDLTLQGNPDQLDLHQRYGINILLEHLSEVSPVVVESNPTLSNLLGGVENRWHPNGQVSSDYQGVRGGSLLAADGGYLILDAHDVVAHPGAWQILMRTLRTGLLEIVPAEFDGPGPTSNLKPEPIPVTLRVVLIGNHELYYHLDKGDYDFAELFKVLADFDDTMDRNDDSVQLYARVLSRIAREERLRHFTPCAVAALAEHGARIAQRSGRLTTRFGRVADLAREASWLAGVDDQSLTSGEHVSRAIARTKRRASLPSTRFHAQLKDQRVSIDTSGKKVGQINGLAVIGAGPIRFGFPARITASIGAGNGGIIDIESSSQLSGSIHTKGFHILGGLLRHLLKADHPLAFSASLAFEQSYGGIDGDSASGAEICCLISALTRIPIHQGIAITGAIDQHGALQTIGGVNEKIEGFFDLCQHFGLSGEQGVIIPTANATDLMLRHDVVAAAEDKRFHVYAVTSVCEALEILTGQSAGAWNADAQSYPEDSILFRARQRAAEYWQQSRRGHS